jgi:DNA-binding winged helix-turn-helix (wHTH) protein
MPLMDATAHAVEGELLIQRLKNRPRTGDSSNIGFMSGNFVELPRRQRQITLHVMGQDEGTLTTSDGQHTLGRRHSEILLLLANSTSGVAGEKLAEQVYGNRTSLPTLRSEMVRFRKTLEPIAPELIPASQPYRLNVSIETDAHQVISLIERGAHRAALSAYRGDILPGSDSPGVIELQDETRSVVREAILSSGSVDVLLDYVDSSLGTHDVEALGLLLRLLPPKSPKRARLVVRLEAIEQST